MVAVGDETRHLLVGKIACEVAGYRAHVEGWATWPNFAECSAEKRPAAAIASNAINFHWQRLSFTPRIALFEHNSPLLADDQALELLLELMTIDGLSGNETEVADFLQERLQAAGAPPETMHEDRAHQRSKIGGNRGNLILQLPGTQRQPRRMFIAHMDTVPICAATRPVRKGNRVESRDSHTGLGADNRAGCAVLLSTALAILKSGRPHPPLTFLWTVEEEAGLHGARHVQKSLLGRPRLAFNFDGGEVSRLTIGATGGYRMEIDVRGIASHAGGHPERGVSAIAIASLAISELVKGGWHGLVEKNRQRGTCNVGVIQGGMATNVVTDHVHLRAEARSHNAPFRERIVQEIEQAFQKAARQVTNEAGNHGDVAIEGRLDYEAFLLKRTESCVEAAAEAVRAEGLAVEYYISNGGLDANWLTAHGIPTVTLGCGQNQIHTVDEWLDVEEFHRARRVAWRLATS